MPGPEIPETDHVSRLCGAARRDEQGRPLGLAFRLRSGESYLSVNWLELTQARSRTDQLANVRVHLQGKGISLGATACLAVLHLGSTFDLVAAEWKGGSRLHAHHEPTLPSDPSHAGIYGYAPEDRLVAQLIALSVAEIHPARG